MYPIVGMRSQSHHQIRVGISEPPSDPGLGFPKEGSDPECGVHRIRGVAAYE